VSAAQSPKNHEKPPTDARISDRTSSLARKEDILKLQLEVEKRFNQFTIWIVGTAIGLGGLIIGISKL
jgi:hypothetical protein